LKRVKVTVPPDTTPAGLATTVESDRVWELSLKEAVRLEAVLVVDALETVREWVLSELPWNSVPPL
jgi:hypothetical protein